MTTSPTEQYRAGFVALGGRSNVGKSTLLNRLIGCKVAIVTPLPQTTRRRILGIRTDPDAQLILIDAPGVHESRKLLNQRMVGRARACLKEGDVVVGLIHAAPRIDRDDLEFLAEFRELRQPKIIAINKIDLIPRPSLIPLAEQCAQMAPGAEIVPVSALSGENVEELVSTIKALLPLGGALMPDDQYTDQSERMLAEEVILEKIFFAMREEIPFSTAVKVEEFISDAERKLLRIAALIVVERESHKGMIIGAGGRRLKEIGQAARIELEQLFESKIFLQLTVKVEKNWTRDPRRIEELGL
ncbi:MAG TPA: GTPase Era [Candidatus Binataceae bacterium]|nr:GTPase Era [Candidatus Binataceae bacterium]